MRILSPEKGNSIDWFIIRNGYLFLAGASVFWCEQKQELVPVYMLQVGV